jgi:hypothetical protein
LLAVVRGQAMPQLELVETAAVALVDIDVP